MCPAKKTSSIFLINYYIYVSMCPLCPAKMAYLLFIINLRLMVVPNSCNKIDNYI